MATDATIIPGQGWVYIADPDTPVPDLSKFVPSDPTTVTGFESLGHTSADNTIALEKEGGEVTVRNSWDTPGLRSELSAVNWAAIVNALDFNQGTLALAFPNGEWDEETKSFGFGGNTGSSKKAVLIIMKDTVNGYAAIYFPNGSISIGEAPSIAIDAFFEIQLRVTALASSQTGDSIRFYPPVMPESGVIPDPEVP